jgi:putative membrane protein
MNAAGLPDEAAVFAIERPSPKLFTYYLLSSLLLGPLFFIPLIPLYFRYHTLRYRFDEEGISMRWGILFRREINLTYARIQDIHLRSNVVERWLDLARIEVQTASGSSGAEMTLEGLLEFEAIRDYLYARMRGSLDRRPAAPAPASSPRGGVDTAVTNELTATLREVTAELRALREALAGRDRSFGGD